MKILDHLMTGTVILYLMKLGSVLEMLTLLRMMRMVK